MSTTWDEARIQSYIDGKIEESLTLDYKAADAISADKKRDITKDVSSFANSAGGVIIYGLAEYADEPRKHLAEKITSIDRRQYSKEWLEQIISQIQPRITPLIHSVQLSSSPHHVAYVVEIPQSATAHQASDQRYYKRFNFQSVPMFDYEIRDVMRRRQHPQIELDLSLFLAPTLIHNRVRWNLRNVSDVMARHFSILIHLPYRLKRHSIKFNDVIGYKDDEGYFWWPLNVSNGNGSPLFPHSRIYGEFTFEVTPPRNTDYLVRDYAQARIYADEMQPQYAKFNLSDVLVQEGRPKK